MDFTKLIKIELSLGEQLRRKWKERKKLKDNIIEKSIYYIIEHDERFALLSSINIEVSRKWIEKDINRAMSTLKLSSNSWEILIIMVHNRSDTHWSCLMYVKNTNSAYHYDSISSFNQEECKDLTILLQDLHIFNEDTILYERLFIDQEAGFECGYYLLICAYLSKISYNGDMPIDKTYIIREPNYINNILSVIFGLLDKNYF
jgi:hypothetical protein